MARERRNPGIPATFRSLGGFAQKKTDLWNAIRAMNQARGRPDPNAAGAEPGGQPDYLWLLPPCGGFIEVKDGGDNFAFAAINTRQRDWLSEWADISWLWLFMGTGRAGSAGRAAYLIDWPAWLAGEQQAAAHGLSGLAWRAPHRREHRAAGLSVEGLFTPCRLIWKGKNAWDIPAAHFFWRRPALFFDRWCVHNNNALQESAYDTRPLGGDGAAQLALVAARS
jgi:hypothetical protein